MPKLPVRTGSSQFRCPPPSPWRRRMLPYGLPTGRCSPVVTVYHAHTDTWETPFLSKTRHSRQFGTPRERGIIGRVGLTRATLEGGCCGEGSRDLARIDTGNGWQQAQPPSSHRPPPRSVVAKPDHHTFQRFRAPVALTLPSSALPNG
jgi:hypothetical protein